MKEIILFHSYNYINTKYKIIDNCFYDYNNNFLFEIINLPSNKNIYSLKLEKKLINKKLSFFNRKNEQFYTTNNLKIFVKINYNKFIQNFKNIENNDIKILFNLLKQNFIRYIDYNNKFVDTICLNKKYNKNLDNIFKNTHIKNDFNIIKLYDLFFDLNFNKIYYQNYIYNNININFSIILYDLDYFMINELNSYLIKHSKINILLITKNKQNWHRLFNYSNIEFIDTYEFTKKYDLVVIDNYYENKIINSKKIIYLSNKLNTISINNLLQLLQNYYNLKHMNISYDILYKIIKNIMYIRNYKKNLNLTIKHIDIDTDKYNFCKIANDDKIFLNSECNICYNKITSNTICKTSCNHYFCFDCIKTIFKGKNHINCPYCRQKLYKRNIIKLFITNENFNYIVKNLKSNNILIGNNTILNFTKKILKYVNCKKNINYINNKLNNKLALNKYNICILNNKNYDIDTFLNNNLEFVYM